MFFGGFLVGFGFLMMALGALFLVNHLAELSAVLPSVAIFDQATSYLDLTLIVGIIGAAAGFVLFVLGIVLAVNKRSSRKKAQVAPSPVPPQYRPVPPQGMQYRPVPPQAPYAAPQQAAPYAAPAQTPYAAPMQPTQPQAPAFEVNPAEEAAPAPMQETVETVEETAAPAEEAAPETGATTVLSEEPPKPAFCYQCGAPLTGTAFCANCGAKLK